MHTKTFTIKATDTSGNVLTGKSVTIYPAGTTSNGVTGTTDSEGLAEITVDPSTDPNSIAYNYDVYWDGSKQFSFCAGEWIFSATVSITGNPTTITFSSEADIPDTIPNAELVSLFPIGGSRGLFMNTTGAITDSDIDISVSPAGNPSSYPFDAQIIIRGG